MPTPTDPMSVERAIGLGGGGPVGIAWEAGIAAGLEAEGIDLSRADRVLGTSAGSFVGAQLASGRSAGSLADAQIALGDKDAADKAAGKATSAERLPKPNLMPLIQLMMKPLGEGQTQEDRLREFGQLSLTSQTIDEDAFVEGFGKGLSDLGWPGGFACTAVDVASGAFRLWEAADGAALARAVASSCSVPGIFPPITIDGARYMDGGMRSATNFDLLKGARRVIAVAVVGTLGLETQMERIRGERAALGEDTAFVLITPDEVSLKAFGPNLMEATDRAGITRAGIEQGRREAEKAAAVWE